MARSANQHRRARFMINASPENKLLGSKGALHVELVALARWRTRHTPNWASLHRQLVKRCTGCTR